jgi:uncharacterized protein YkwD
VITTRARAAAALLALATAAVAAGCSAEAGRPAATPSATPATYGQLVVEETNAVRAEHGLGALAPSECARDQALTRADALLGSDELTHAPLTPVQQACAPPSGIAAGNLSRSAAAPADVVQAWMGSPGHRNNLLDPGLTHIGVGCVPDEAGVMLCSQVFLG